LLYFRGIGIHAIGNWAVDDFSLSLHSQFLDLVLSTILRYFSPLTAYVALPLTIRSTRVIMVGISVSETVLITRERSGAG